MSVVPEILLRFLPMAEEVAEGRVNILQLQYVVTQGNLFGTRTLLEEGAAHKNSLTNVTGDTTEANSGGCFNRI